MQAVVAALQRVAPSNVSVLLCGETGTGKEVLARELHNLSPRREKPFEVIDCGSLAPNLIGSELLGHERGAFTGAIETRLGAFERADGGTVFLDEIGELPLELQPVLLGVLERRRFRRVGGSRERSVDVRVVSATHRDLRAGTFRQDLYFRLAVVRIDIPPLRERREDVRPLVEHFANSAAPDRKHLESCPTLENYTADDRGLLFTPGEWAQLDAYPFPGNVRELRNLVESAVVLGRLVIEAPGSISEAATIDPGPNLSYRDARRRAVDAWSTRWLGRLLAACKGNASEAARRAQMDRPYLLSLLRRHGLR